MMLKCECGGIMTATTFMWKGMVLRGRKCIKCHKEIINPIDAQRVTSLINPIDAQKALEQVRRNK